MIKLGRITKVFEARKKLAELKGWLKYYRKKNDQKNVAAIQRAIDDILGTKQMNSRTR